MKIARASSTLVAPYGSRRTPSGPTAPATRRSSPAAARAIAAAARLICAHLRPEAVLSELQPVRPEGVRFDDLGSGLDVALMDGVHQVGFLQVQLVVALVDEDAAAVEHGSRWRRRTR